ncbi:hypothetical protein ES703_65776 [subsurface metagenome]
MKRKFKVYSINTFSETVLIMSLEDANALDPSKIIQPQTQMDRGVQMGQRILKTILPAGALAMMRAPPFVTNIKLTTQEYEELGKPTIGDTINLELKKGENQQNGTARDRTDRPQ